MLYFHWCLSVGSLVFVPVVFSIFRFSTVLGFLKGTVLELYGVCVSVLQLDVSDKSV